MGEGADDAGGVFDETVAQMCEVRGCEWVEGGMCVCVCAHINEKHMWGVVLCACVALMLCIHTCTCS